VSAPYRFIIFRKVSRLYFKAYHKKSCEYSVFCTKNGKRLKKFHGTVGAQVNGFYISYGKLRVFLIKNETHLSAFNGAIRGKNKSEKRNCEQPHAFT